MESKKELLRKLIKLERDNPTKEIQNPEDAVPPFMKWANKTQEHFLVMTLDGAHQVIKTRAITKGCVNRCIVHPREVFIEAIKNNAVSIILAHNHPSGSLKPSTEDMNLFFKMRDASELLGFNLLDFLIVSKNGYLSFAEKGYIFEESK